MSRVLVLVLLACCAGCYQATYQHLGPPPPPQEGVPASAAGNGKGWQHFFVYGWVPNRKIIRAAEICGGADQIDRIETGQTFVQGLIESLASFYINIYSPYTGRVVCRSQGSSGP